MELGAFSLSLAVKDLAVSKAFYEKLGFEVLGGNEDQNWLILRNGSTVLGLFAGMFDKNMLTWNPGWNQNAEEVNPFTDVRELHRKLSEAGLELQGELDLDGQGPGHFYITDPDGNPILIDQHR
ncbi:MAG: VOC family protein [Weeksellaceae bacterium]|nr:VOC family protein [Weeksellaceae bacterium]